MTSLGSPFLIHASQATYQDSHSLILHICQSFLAKQLNGIFRISNKKAVSFRIPQSDNSDPRKIQANEVLVSCPSVSYLGSLQAKRKYCPYHQTLAQPQ